MELAVSRIAERNRQEAEASASQEKSQSRSTSPKLSSTSQAFLDRTSRLALPPSDRERGDILGPTRDLLVRESGKVVGAVTKPLKEIGNFVFGEVGEIPSDRSEGAAQTSEEQVRDREEEEAELRLANAEIQRAERAEREQRGQTLEMLVQMFPGMDLLVQAYQRFG